MNVRHTDVQDCRLWRLVPSENCVDGFPSREEARHADSQQAMLFISEGSIKVN
jgi:hypothetical protein